MKIKSKIFQKFIRCASLDGTILTSHMNFEEDGVRCCIQSYDNIALTHTVLKKEAFEEYKPIGEIYIKDTMALINYLKTFGDSLSIDNDEEYILRLSDETREAKIIMGSDLVATNIYKKELPIINSTTEVPLKKADLVKSIKDMNNLKINKIVISKISGEINFEVGSPGESDWFINKTVTESEGEGNTSIGDYIISIYNILDKDFVLKLGVNVPVIFEETTEFVTFVCFIAPIIE